MTFDVQFSAPDPSTFNPKNPQTLHTDIPVYDPTQAVIDPKTNGLATRDWRFERGNGGEWLINGPGLHRHFLQATRKVPVSTQP